MKTRVSLSVNGETHELLVPVHKTLLEVLREDLGLTGTKHGCELGECGTCTVLVDGEPMLSCLALPADCEGRRHRHRRGHGPRAACCIPLQQAFAELGAAQCGYCTPGILLTAQALLDGRARSRPASAIREALAGNLCRCTGLHQDPRRRRAGRAPHAAEPAAARRRGEPHEQPRERQGPIHRSSASRCPRSTPGPRSPARRAFADDLVLPRMAFGKLLRSPHAHALIKRIDTARARALPGVYAVITGHDLPRVKFGILPVSPGRGGAVRRRRCAWSATRWPRWRRWTRRRRSAACRADRGRVRAAAGAHVDRGVAGPPRGPHPRVRRRPQRPQGVALQFGDVEAAFAAADLVREDVFYFEGNTHLPMEQHAAVAHCGPDGKLTLWSSTQTPHYVHRLLAKILDLPGAHIRVIAAPVGGGFGGKLDPFAHEIAACKLSQLTGRPVKIALHPRGGLLHPPRPASGAHVDQDRLHAGRRHHRLPLPHLARRRRLRLLRRGLDLLHGRAPDRSPTRCPSTSSRAPACSPTSRRAAPSAATARPQPRFALECQIDQAAEQLGLDPADMRGASSPSRSPRRPTTLP